VVALITPLPSFVLDLLIVATSSGLGDGADGVLIPGASVEFTAFPPPAPIDAFRLALNIPPRDLILLDGNTGTSAAGEIIGAFGSFVVGATMMIGAVIFLVLIAIQYIVINHGAVRISEVTARFTLDAAARKARCPSIAI